MSRVRKVSLKKKKTKQLNMPPAEIHACIMWQVLWMYREDSRGTKSQINILSAAMMEFP